MRASRALYVAAELGIADILAAGPMTSEELGAKAWADGATLRRLMRALVAHGVHHLCVTCYTEGFSHFFTSMTAPAVARPERLPGGACHSPKSAIFSWRTRKAGIANGWVKTSQRIPNGPEPPVPIIQASF
jgi:hypothetical protein